LFLKYSYTLFLYTTPYLVYSILLSGVYIFVLKAGRKIRAGKLPLYPAPRKRTELSLVVGEVHQPRKQIPSETPRWLVIPERGLFTGIDRKSTRLNSSHLGISYAVFCLKKKIK